MVSDLIDVGPSGATSVVGFLLDVVSRLVMDWVFGSIKNHVALDLL